jgi:flagellar motility protein MotE (MotC chaperone)
MSQTINTIPANAGMNYKIDETLARFAKSMNSFRDYVPDSATREYEHDVIEARGIARQKLSEYPDKAERINYLLDLYERKLAEWINENNRIECMCPSVMISGPSKFPVRKKERQNARRKSHMEELNKVENILEKLENINDCEPISGDDENAIDKLKIKLESLKVNHEKMKLLNTRFRKFKNIDEAAVGIMPPDEIESLKSNWPFHSSVPYPQYKLTNNLAEIRRIEGRIKSIERLRQAEYKDIEFQGGKVEYDKKDNRIKVYFDSKPERDIIKELKSTGFHWSPRQAVWMRQITANALFATKNLRFIQNGN